MSFVAKPGFHSLIHRASSVIRCISRRDRLGLEVNHEEGRVSRNIVYHVDNKLYIYQMIKTSIPRFER